MGALGVATALLSPGGVRVGAQAPGNCAPPSGNPIVCENLQPGNPSSEWDISGAGDVSIQGFSTDISVNRGQTISFKIDTVASNYRLDIYRMGYYGGLGARSVATVTPSATLPQTQPTCLSDPATGLIDCGNWAVSASWTVPSTAVSGIYFAKVLRSDTGGASHIVFVVRDDASHSDLLFQTSDTTWQAYNQYGGNSLYTGSPAGRAYKVSYNRPLTVRGITGEDSVFNAEYPMVRWLEANGYDVSYFSGMDTDRRGADILQHKVFLSVGHDEYWSGTQRTNVENARAAGVNLAFFGGNEVYWKTRWENSISSDASAHRTLVSYKETHANAKIDPTAAWTGTWRDPRFSPPADGGRPENALTGTIFMVNSGTTGISVPSAEGKMRFWRNTSVANLAPGASALMPAGTLGFEWDEDRDNGFRPAGSIRLSDTTVAGVDYLQDFGSTYAPGTANHALMFYRHASGARVFGAGTVQWSWGLDSNHDRGSAAPSVDMQQATINLLADMGIQPFTVQDGLTTAAPSTDTIAPTSTITSPVNGSSVPASAFVTLSGTAIDAGGGVVGGVEISVDGGTTWHRATGRETWTFSWTTGAAGPISIFSRAVDDSGNLEQPGTSISLTADWDCPCSIWSSAQVPGVVTEPDGAAVEVGVKFRTSLDGFITGIRFYKGPQNTGAHAGHLWTTSGTLLSTVNFSGESASGWQTGSLPQPFAVTANTTYIVSYYSPNGFYSTDAGYFSAAYVNGPLEALASATSGGNGVYRYGASGFPSATFSASNYWVDVVFATSVGPDTTLPAVVATTPAGNATNVGIASPIRVQFNEAVNSGTISSATFELRDAGGNLVAGVVSYVRESAEATLQPSAPLAYSGSYSATIKGGSLGVKDLAGNALAANYTWTFATREQPPDEGPGGPILIVASAANLFTKYYAEILRAEGLNAFLVTDISAVTASALAAHDVVILGEIALSPAQVNMFTSWVTAGGKLIAMRPDKQLAGLMGLTDAGGTLSDAYLRIDTSTAPGAGIAGETMQFHGAGDLYGLSGASSVATFYSNATTGMTAPAVTLRSVGTAGGQVAAFAYDLARSVVLTRQGNPDWAGQERDGIAPIRSDELFFGGTVPDYMDRSKVAIPQADEQQRLLANVIGHLTHNQKPLPRFWYFPRGLKAAVVMTGDDHANNGTAGQFNFFNSRSAPGCNVANWECVRGSSYIYPNTPITPTQAAAYVAQGFEIGVHVQTGCSNYTPSSLDDSYRSSLTEFALMFGNLPAQKTNRTHCIVWSDYSTQAEVSLAHGIRLDTNYYYWPSTWVNNAPGVFTGSAMPMRFAKTDGTMIDVYQATTQMTDESGQAYPFTIDTLLDRALGAEGYYGAYVANMHTDYASHPGAQAIVASAQARGVPVISARQLLDWLDGRNGAAYTVPVWSGNSLTFGVSADARANGLRMLVPATSGNRVVSAVTQDGQPVSFTIESVKAVPYAVFNSPPGTYAVEYAVDNTAPAINAVDVAADAFDATVTWTTNEGTTSRVAYGTNPGILNSSAASATLGTRHSVQLKGLSAGTTYYFRAIAADVLGNTATSPAPPVPPMSFTTLVTSTFGCPCSIWNAGTAPSLPSANDASAVELGVKFRPSADGYVTAIRFYKGPLNTGAHLGNLWSSTGTLLGTVTFSGESATGWQQATLARPVAVTANTTYVVSYHTTSGGYAADLRFFQNAGVTNGPLQALAEGVSGSNGVFRYGSSGFPSQSFNSAKYWVDLVFVSTLPPQPPPTVGVTDTTEADFQAGTLGVGTYVAGFGDGEVILSPALEEFSGTSVPTGWSSSAWSTGGTSSVAGGRVTVDGSLLTSDALLSPGQSVEFIATFSAVAFQQGGFGLTFNENRWAMFSTGFGNSLMARTHNGATAIDTPLSASWLGAPHRFRIDWTSSGVTFFIDGTQVALHTQAISAQMRPAFSDFTVGGGDIAVESVRMTPYATTGTFTSRVLDVGYAINWASATSTATVPAGTTLALSVRFGNSPLPDGTWAPFTAFDVGSATISGTSQYAQYRAELSGTGSATPVLEAISLSGPGVPPTPSLSIDDTSVIEGSSGTTYAVFPLSLSAAVTSPVSVSYATADGSATAGSDYTAVSGTAVIPAGSTFVPILVPIVPDTDIDPAETFRLTLSAPVNATLAQAQATATIVDDDVPSLSIADTSIVEGDAGTSTAVFTVWLSTPSEQEVTVNFASSDATAMSPQDYTAVSGTLMFPPGTTTRQVIVPVVGDTGDEPDKAFTVTLSSAVNAPIIDAMATGTIVDNDATPSLAIGDVSIPETDTGSATATFSVTLSAASGQTVSVLYSTADGAAVAPADYTSTSGTLTFSPGETVKQIPVTVVGDLIDEPNETFRVNLSSPVHATIGDSQALGTILDNDLPVLSLNDLAVTEGNTGTLNAVFTVSLSSAIAQPVTVNYAASDGTAVAPGDYTAVSGTLTIPAGATTGQITVRIVGDTLDEPDETLTVTLTAPANAVIADGTGVGTIMDNDATPSLVVNNLSVTETDSGTVPATFTVTLSAASGQPVTVNYASANATATDPADYTAVGGTLTFAPGVTTQQIQVLVNGDTLDEPNETYQINLSVSLNATIADAQGIGTIVDNDSPAISIGNRAVTEGNTGSLNAAFTVSLSNAHSLPVSVNYATSDGTAVAPADYTAVSGTLTIPAGATTATINVPVAGDVLDEANETFTVTLSTPVNVTIANGTGLGTINDNDATPTLAINDVTVTETDSDTVPATFTVTLSAASGRPVTVNYASANATATAPADYTPIGGTLTFAPGVTTQQIGVLVNGDTLEEPNETYQINLSVPVNATIADAQGIGSIVDNELPTISIGNRTVTEGNTGTLNAAFTVSLSNAHSLPVSVNYATSDGTAVAPADYTAVSGTLTIPAGATTATINVPVVADVLDEANETFTVTLSVPVDGTIATGTGLGTITDDDATTTLAVNDVTVTETDAGTVLATFTVTLSAASGRTVTVNRATANATATSPADYAALASSALTFAPGTTTQDVAVTVSSDLLNEVDETFQLRLSGAVNATIADATGVATIVDNDPIPTATINDVSITEANTGTRTMTFTVTLSAASGRTITMAYATADGTATAPSDYTAATGTLTFTAGILTRTITITSAGDATIEPNETLLVNLSGAVNVTLADSQGVGTIVNND